MTTLDDIARRTATLDVVVGAAQEDAAGLFRSLLSDPVERAAQGLREAVPAVAESYGSMASRKAVVWYEDVRPAGVRAFRAHPATPSLMADIEGLTTWAATPLFTGDAAATWERIAGLLQKSITDHDRATIEGNAERDPVKPQWRRWANGDSCAYCAYMAVVLDQPDYGMAAKKYHDFCRCVPIVEFPGDTLPDQPNSQAWSQTFADARDLIMEERRSLPGWARMRRSDRIKAYPDHQLNTRNILARARRLQPDLFRDGVHTAP